MPGLMLIARTSPSMGEGSVYVWVTLSTLPARSKYAFWRARSTSAVALRQLSSDAS